MGGCNGTKLLLERANLKGKVLLWDVYVCVFFYSSKDTTQVSEFWQRIWNSEQFKSSLKHTIEREKKGEEVKKGGGRKKERREEERENCMSQEQRFCDLFGFIAAVPYTADHLA